LDRVHAGAVEILAVIEQLALHFGSGYEVVHAVETAQQGALAASRRADQGRDVVAVDVHRYPLHRGDAAVQDIDVTQLEHLLGIALAAPVLELLRADRYPRPRGGGFTGVPPGLGLIVLRHLLAQSRPPTTFARNDSVARSRRSSSPAGRRA